MGEELKHFTWESHCCSGFCCQTHILNLLCFRVLVANKGIVQLSIKNDSIKNDSIKNDSIKNVELLK